MKEMQAAIETAFKQMVESGALNKVITESVEKSVTSVIKQTFESYSPFQKALTENVNKSLVINFDDLGLAGYNDMLLKIIKSRVDASIFKTAEKQITEGMDELMASPPAEVKLSDLVKEFRKYAAEDRPPDSEISFHCKDSDSSTGYFQCAMDEKSGKPHYDCGYRFAVTDKGEIYSLKFPHEGDVTKGLFVGRRFGFEKTLFQLWACKTKMVMDVDDVDAY